MRDGKGAGGTKSAGRHDGILDRERMRTSVRLCDGISKGGFLLWAAVLRSVLRVPTQQHEKMGCYIPSYDVNAGIRKRDITCGHDPRVLSARLASNPSPHRGRCHRNLNG